MVMRRLILLALSLVCWQVAAFTPSVEVEVLGEQQMAQQKIPPHLLEGRITIHRSEADAVDAKSFAMEGRPFEVAFLYDSVQSTLTIINGVRSESKSVASVYRFTLPKPPPGHHQLPPITVSVGGQTLTSRATPYSVFAAEEDGRLQLEVFVRRTNGVLLKEGASIYPGEMAEFGYYLRFRGALEPTHTQLPLMEAEGFRKVGEEKRQLKPEAGGILQETWQQVQALAPGTHTFGPSAIEGIPYRRDFFGHRTYERIKVCAKAPAVTVQVVPFPAKGKPVEFDGALGKYTLSARLLTPENMVVGDRIRIALTIAGEGEWSTVHCPQLAQRAEFAGKFRLGDLPPTTQPAGNERRFVIEMRPLSADVTCVPSITFASFDPQTGLYHTTSTDPLPITVTAGSVPNAPTANPTAAEHVMSMQPRRLNEIMSYTSSSLPARGTSWSALWIFPIGLAVIGGQLLLRASWRQRHHRRGKLTVEQRLIAALLEKGEFSTHKEPLTIHPLDLPVAGIAGEVRQLLLKLEEVRFSPSNKGSAMTEEEILLRQGRRLLRRLGRKPLFRGVGSGKALLLGIALVLTANVGAESLVASWEAACEAYAQAESALDDDGAAAGFNAALATYSELASESPSPALSAQIGNCYYQLGEAPLALAYYRRVLAAYPRDSRIKHNARVAAKSMGLSNRQWQESNLWLEKLLSLQERIFGAALLGLLGVVLVSMGIWSRRIRGVTWRLAFANCLIVGYLLVGIGVSAFWGSPKGVLIEAVLPRCDAGESYAASADALPAGTGVKILNKTGEWIEVCDRLGQRGFVPQSTVVPIEG